MGAGSNRSHEKLHCPIRSRISQAGKTSSVQRKNSGQDGRRRADREGQGGQELVLLLLLVRHNPSTSHHGAGMKFKLSWSERVACALSMHINALMRE